MTISSKKKIDNSSKRAFLIVGAIIFLLWPAVSVRFVEFMNILSVGPIALGAIIFSIGAVYDLKVERPLKALLVIAGSFALVYVGYWLSTLWFWIELWLGAVLGF